MKQIIKPAIFEAKRPTKEDEQELVDLNFENPEHKPTSDLGHSLPGVGVLGAGRSSGLFGHSLPSPAVQAEKSGTIPGQNAKKSFGGDQISSTSTPSTVLYKVGKRQAVHIDPEGEVGTDSFLLSTAGESRKIQTGAEAEPKWKRDDRRVTKPKKKMRIDKDDTRSLTMIFVSS